MCATKQAFGLHGGTFKMLEIAIDTHQRSCSAHASARKPASCAAVFTQLMAWDLIHGAYKHGKFDIYMIVNYMYKRS